jgi:hypothetical protein
MNSYGVTKSDGMPVLIGEALRGQRLCLSHRPAPPAGCRNRRPSKAVGPGQPPVAAAC